MKKLLAGVAVAAAVTATACGDSGGESTLTVFAAASLTDAFGEMAEAFEASHDGVQVELNFASSSTLAVQITEGAPGDVFASANQAQMDVVVAAGIATEPQTFATNFLVVAVPGDSSTVEDFADLAGPGIALVLAAPDVPAGDFARQVLSNASRTNSPYGGDFAERVLSNVVSQEPDVRSVLSKVELGEADAGIVYATDVAATHGEVKRVEIPVEFNVVAEYPIATVSDAGQLALAREFIAFILSAEGQATLRKHGFGTID